MPIGYNSHWTLCVIVNAGGLLNKLQSSNTVLFMLFFDSKEGFHDFNIVASTVRKWLNYSAHQKYSKQKQFFTETTLKAFSPKGMCCNQYIIQLSCSNLFYNVFLQFLFKRMILIVVCLCVSMPTVLCFYVRHVLLIKTWTKSLKQRYQKVLHSVLRLTTWKRFGQK